MTISIPQASFDANKQSLKDFYKSQNVFTDIDFEGSHISALVDGLAFNTTINEYYYNMAVNETRRSTARQRYNVIARAQENGYVPKSFTSATAVVNFDITSSNVNRSTVVIPKNTVITGSVDNRMFTFSTVESVLCSVSSSTPSTLTFSATNVLVVEGLTTSDSFLFSSSSDLFNIPNEQVDVSSIAVSVIENNQSPVPYRNAKSVIGIGPTDKVYFVRINADQQYSIYFGDGVTGYRPLDNSVVVVDYRISNGQLPNGIKVFYPGQSVDGESNVMITTVTPSQGGDVFESTESIRYNGDQATITQQRSIYQDDFENDIRDNFPIIADISVIGGEDVFPPQYGKILITAVDKQLNNLTDLDITAISQFLTKRTPLSSKFVFNKANILRVGVNSKITATNLQPSTVTAITAAIEDFADQNIGQFNKSLYRSRLETAINQSSPSVVSNSTALTLIAKATTGSSTTVITQNQIKSVSSQSFTYNNVQGTLVDMQGSIVIINSNGVIISPQAVGTVDYANGVIELTPFYQQFNQAFDLVITPVNDDINVTGNMIIKINPLDVVIA